MSETDRVRQKLNEALTLTDGIRVAPHIDPAYTQEIAGAICALIQEAMLDLGAERIRVRRNETCEAGP